MNDETAGGPGAGHGPGTGPDEEPTRVIREQPTREIRSGPPLSGPSIPAGSGVVLGVSMGQAPAARTTRPVPSVLGLRQDEALAALQAAGFSVEILRNANSTVTAGMVAHQYPAAGAVATSGSRVAIIVSAGPPAEAARMTVLPDVVGKGESAATATLAEAGLRSATVSDYNAAVPAGVVQAQEPNASSVRAYVAEKKGSKAWLWILIAVVAVAAAAAAWYLSTSGGEQVSVPDVTGTTVAEAETALTNAGLELGTVTEKANTDVEAGQIVSQDPEAGESVDEGTRVDVVAAAIPEGVEVPDVTGESVSKARSELRGAGLTSRVNETYHDTVAEGNVIRQSPGAGTRVEEGAEIALTVSLGPKPIENVTVPKVTDMTAAAAQQTIEGAGLTYQTIDYYSPTVAAGNVGAQFPAAGESVAPDTRVMLAVSSGPLPGVGVGVPMVVGSTEADAKATLEAAGFVVEVVQQVSSADEGDVFWQFPEVGSEQPAGATVAIGVSTGS